MSAVKKIQEKNDTIWDDFISQNSAAPWMQDVRKSSYHAFAASGLPTKRSERYKYTDIPAAEAGRYFPYANFAYSLKGDTSFVKELDNRAPDWVKTLVQAVPVGEAQYKDMALWHAANAYLRDGLVIDIPKNTTDAMPLQIDIKGVDDVSYVPRVFIRVGENAEFTVIERHEGTGAYWNNAVMQIELTAGARLRHYRIVNDSAQAIYTQNTHVTIARDATYEAFALTMGASLSRNQIHAELRGENAEVRLGGVNLLSGTQHGDTTITIEHAAPNCRSNQTYKSIIDDKAHGVFQGKVHVHQIAQKTDGYQLYNTLLLSKTAEMDTKPELEIYADDVKCSHGATTGQLDTAPLFYLRSRGLSEAEAKMLLMQAFLGPALEEIRDEATQAVISELALNWLSERAQS